MKILMLMTGLLFTGMNGFAAERFVVLGGLEVTPEETAFSVSEPSTGIRYQFLPLKKDAWCVRLFKESGDLLKGECIPLSGGEFKPSGSVDYWQVNPHWAEVAIVDRQGALLGVVRLTRSYERMRPLAATTLQIAGDRRASVLLVKEGVYQSPWVRTDFFNEGDLAAYMDYFSNSGSGIVDDRKVIQSVSIPRSR